MPILKYLRKVFNSLSKLRFKYLIYGSKITIEKGGVFSVGKNVTIRRSSIYVKKGDTLIIGDDTNILSSSINMIAGGKAEIKIGKHCKIGTYNLSITWGFMHIGDYNIIEKGDNIRTPSFEIAGHLVIGNYNHILCDICGRFSGKVSIGNRNAINEGTEIRGDNNITIGDYNQISYNCYIWDTNTHNIYKAEKRREITDLQYPDVGLEFEKPKTAPVFIGSDCWIGKDVTILKGTKLENKCIIALGTLLTNVSIAENKTIFNKSDIKIIDNQL